MKWLNAVVTRQRKTALRPKNKKKKKILKERARTVR